MIHTRVAASQEYVDIYPTYRLLTGVVCLVAALGSSDESSRSHISYGCVLVFLVTNTFLFWCGVLCCWCARALAYTYGMFIMFAIFCGHFYNF